MTQSEQFEKSFERPRNHWSLSPQEQWDIDASLGILDMDYHLTPEDEARFLAYYE